MAFLAYIEICMPDYLDFRPRIDAYIKWLDDMKAQVYKAMPYQVNRKRGLPDGSDVKEWARQLVELVASQVADRVARFSGVIDRPTAVQVQRAVLAALVTGLEFPPIRLWTLKTLMHPDHNGRCHDAECNVRDCLGNRVEVDEGEGAGIVLHVGHGKTERWQRKDFAYSIAVPEGKFADLFRLHIAEGQALMTSHVYEGHSVDRLFVNNQGEVALVLLHILVAL